MTGNLRPFPAFALAAFLLLGTGARAWGQYTWTYADLFYDEVTDQVYGFGVTVVDYSTLYYYDPKVNVTLSGNDGYSEDLDCSPAAVCSFGVVALGGISTLPKPGVRYTVVTKHFLGNVYYYLSTDPWCTYNCYEYVDALGYSLLNPDARPAANPPPP